MKVTLRDFRTNISKYISDMKLGVVFEVNGCKIGMIGGAKKKVTTFVETEEIMPEDLKKKEKKCKPVKTFFNPMPKSKSTK